MHTHNRVSNTAKRRKEVSVHARNADNMQGNSVPPRKDVRRGYNADVLRRARAAAAGQAYASGGRPSRHGRTIDHHPSVCECAVSAHVLRVTEHLTMASMFQLASRRATAAAAPATRLATMRTSVRGVTVLPPTFSLTAAARAALSTAPPAASAAMAAALTSTTATLQRHVVGGTGVGADALAAAADGEDDETLRTCIREMTGPPRMQSSMPALKRSLMVGRVVRRGPPGSRRAFATLAGSRALARVGSAPHAATPARDASATELSLVSDEEAGSGSEASEGMTTPTSNLSGGTPVNEVAGISDALKSRLLTAGIASLFPVQQETLTRVLAGEDVVVRSRTGSGKTLGFAIPVVELLSREASSKAPRCLVLAPTRELAKQIETEFQRIAGSLRTTSIYGSMSYTLQISALRRGVDVVVGTPGMCRRPPQFVITHTHTHHTCTLSLHLPVSVHVQAASSTC